MSLDDLFDAADKIANKVVGTLKNAHHKDKEYDDDATDAEFTETLSPTLGMVELDDGSREPHLLRGQTDRTMCAPEEKRWNIASRKPLPTDGQIRLCAKCLSIALQTQSKEP